MKNLSLVFQQRCGLATFLASSQGPLAKMTALQRIYLAISFDDEEMAQVHQVPMGDGMVRYEPPSPEWGSKDVQVEDADAEYLKAEIEGRQNLRVSDIGWVEAIKEQLAIASVKRRR